MADKFSKSAHAILVGFCFKGEGGVKVKSYILGNSCWNSIFIILFLIVIIHFRIFLAGSDRFIFSKDFDQLLVCVRFFRIPSAHKC